MSVRLSPITRLKDFLGLERNIVAASSAVFLISLGEELWKKFLPKYLEALGASGIVIATDQPSRCPVRSRR